MKTMLSASIIQSFLDLFLKGFHLTKITTPPPHITLSTAPASACIKIRTATETRTVAT